mmetsp:Transcript_80305/g.222123  ORF Transcript_80305/g.222123 Transcript_80305/m.222123 type:complete len:240 (+) Transcript_80305:324-1043(+)
MPRVFDLMTIRSHLSRAASEDVGAAAVVEWKSRIADIAHMPVDAGIAFRALVPVCARLIVQIGVIIQPDIVGVCDLVLISIVICIKAEHASMAGKPGAIVISTNTYVQREAPAAHIVGRWVHVCSDTIPASPHAAGLHAAIAEITDYVAPTDTPDTILQADSFEHAAADAPWGHQCILSFTTRQQGPTKIPQQAYLYRANSMSEMILVTDGQDFVLDEPRSAGMPASQEPFIHLHDSAT